MKVQNIKASELRNGDEIRLLFMGGTEDVEVQGIKEVDNDIVFETYSTVAPRILHRIHRDSVVRRVEP